MGGDKLTMTLNLSKQEMDVLDQLAADAELSKTQLLRQALRLYQKIKVAQARGERIQIGERNMLFVGPGFDDPPSPPPPPPPVGDPDWRPG